MELFLASTLIIIIFLGLFWFAFVHDFLFHTKLGKKFIYKLGYRSKETLGRYRLYKKNKYVSNYIDQINAMMLNDLLSISIKEEKKINLKKFINLFYSYYRKLYLGNIKGNNQNEKYFRHLMLIALRIVKENALKKIKVDAPVDQ